MDQQDEQSNTKNNVGLWGRVKQQTSKKKEQAKLVAQNAKLRHEMRQLDQQIVSRQEWFGIDLYDTLEVGADADPMFIIDSDALDNIRGEFVACFKDNKALLQTRSTREAQIHAINEQRSEAYPKVPSKTAIGQMKNGAKAANFARKEMGAQNKIKLVDDALTRNKKKFGLVVYEKLVQLEDNHQWFPKDRDIRFLYDQARSDIIAHKSEKEQRLMQLHEIQNTTIHANEL